MIRLRGCVKRDAERAIRADRARPCGARRSLAPRYHRADPEEVRDGRHDRSPHEHAAAARRRPRQPDRDPHRRAARPAGQPRVAADQLDRADGAAQPREARHDVDEGARARAVAGHGRRLRGRRRPRAPGRRRSGPDALRLHPRLDVHDAVGPGRRRDPDGGAAPRLRGHRAHLRAARRADLELGHGRLLRGRRLRHHRAGQGAARVRRRPLHQGGRRAGAGLDGGPGLGGDDRAAGARSSCTSTPWS